MRLHIVSQIIFNLFQALVFIEDARCRFKHIARSDIRGLADMIKMFFEEDDCCGMTKFRFDSGTFKIDL